MCVCVQVYKYIDLLLFDEMKQTEKKYMKKYISTIDERIHKMENKKKPSTARPTEHTHTMKTMYVLQSNISSETN